MTVSLCIIAYNEEKALPKLLSDIANQNYPHEKIEVILVNSMSTDKTAEIMAAFKDNNADFLSVKILCNEKKFQAPGWNAALREATADAIIRMDAHARCPEDFISKTLSVMDKTGESVVGGRVENYSTENTAWSETVNAAENSMFGGSIAKFRSAEKAGYVNTLAFCAYKKEVFERCGEFNEYLLRTEDNEMHYRMQKAGYKFYFTPEIISKRETRSSFKGLLKQKFNNGRWIGMTLGCCPGCISLYHLVPLCFVLAIIITSLLAAFGFWQLSALMWGLYLIFDIVNSVFASLGRKFYIGNPALPFMFLILHIGYGVGTLIGLFEIPSLLRSIKEGSR